MVEGHEIKNFDSAEDYAADYLRTYFMQEPTPDEEVVMAFIAERYKLLKGRPTLLEIGCGPIITHILPAVPYVSKVHLADYRPDNLIEIQKWIDRGEGAHNWNIFTRYVLNLEGILSPSQEQIDERENCLKSCIEKLTICDVRNKQPLNMPITFPAVACFYTTEQASSTMTEWQEVMKNITSLVSPGGDLFMCAMGECDHYILYDKDNKPKKYSVPKLTVKDFEEAFLAAGFPADSMVVKYQKHRGQTLFSLYKR